MEIDQWIRKLTTLPGFKLVSFYQVPDKTFEVSFEHLRTGHVIKDINFDYETDNQFMIEFDKKTVFDFNAETTYPILIDLIYQLETYSEIEFMLNFDYCFLNDFKRIKKDVESLGYKVGYFNIYNDDWLIRWTSLSYILFTNQHTNTTSCVWFNYRLDFRSFLLTLLIALKTKKLAEQLVLEARSE